VIDNAVAERDSPPSLRENVAMRPTDLRVDHQLPAGDPRTPLTATSAAPRLSWAISEPVELVGCRAHVELVDVAGVHVWAADVDASVGFVEVGTPLEAYGQYCWTVRLTDPAGRVAEESQAFEIGPLALGDWGATWLEVPASTLIRTEFVIDSAVTARLHLAAQGLVRASIDDVTLNPSRLDPTRTDANLALYRTFDVQDLLTPGRHHIDFVLSPGEWRRTGLPPRLLAQLTYLDVKGDRAWVAPSIRSLLLPTEIQVDETLYLERHDPTAQRAASPSSPIRELLAAEEPADWNQPPAEVSADGSPLITAHGEIHPVEIGRVGGARQFDVGENIAGRSRITLRTPLDAGTVVRVVHGELLTPDGRVDTTNISMPHDEGRERQVVERRVEGEAGEVVEPWFAYHGFRYLEVRGVPDHAEIEVVAVPLHSALPTRGQVSTDSPIVNELLHRSTRTALNTVHGAPEDCPTREQTAWTGDLASAAEFHFAQFDDAAFMAKWLHDLRTSQEPTGAIPAVSPYIGNDHMPADPVWGAALHRALELHWLTVGDERVVRNCLPALRSWARYQHSCLGSDGIADGFPISYGQDWLALQPTPPELIHSAAVIDTWETLARLEWDAGSVSAADEWTDAAARLRSSMRDRFWNPTTDAIANGSQGAVAAGLWARIWDDEETARMRTRLVDLVRARGNRVTTGFALTRPLVRALGEAGYSEVVWDCLRQPAQPGIGAMIASGPGTLWETWWIDPHNTGTGSLDHVGLGAPFAAWAWEHVVGIRPTAAGYREFEVSPTALAGVADVAATVDTPMGQARVVHRRHGDTRVFEVTVPSGALARVRLKDRAHLVELGPGRHRLTERLTAPSPIDEPPTSAPWSAPELLSPAADEAEAVLFELDGLIPAAGAPAIRRMDPLVCMPVPHAQLPEHPFLLSSTVRDIGPTVRIELADPIPLPSTGFVFAYTDQCVESAGLVTRQLIVIHLDDGSSVRSTSRIWPAGWNRVALDLSGIHGRLVAVEVGIEVDATEERDPLALHGTEGAPAVHLGRVGLSTRMRRW
jgi:alpha-L-rhamnosidase